MAVEIIFAQGEEGIMKRPATLGDVKAIIAANKGMLNGKEIKKIRAEFTPDLKLIKVDFETE